MIAPIIDPDSVPMKRLEQAVYKERMHMLLAHSLLTGLHQMLLYSNDEDASFWADLTKVSAKLVDDAAAQLDWIRLKRVVVGTDEEKIRPRECAYVARLEARARDRGVKEDHPQYCERSSAPGLGALCPSSLHHAGGAILRH